MRTSEAQRYSRFSAAAALAIALIAGGYYARRAWQAKQAERNAPPHVPSSIEKTSQGFSYSKGDGEHTIFTVRASHATQFKAGNHAVLLDVWITMFGPTGARADNIRTKSCDYDQDAGKFSCAGDVALDFQSAADARRGASSGSSANAAPNIVHAETRALSFDRDSGDAWTDQPVALTFPGGNGTAIGVEYRSKDGLINFLHDVKFRLQSGSQGLGAARPAIANGSVKPSPPVDISSSSLEFQRDNGILLLQGPVLAVQSPPGSHRQLRSSDLTVELDTEMHARRITARGSTSTESELRSTSTQGEIVVVADAFAADFAAAGWMQHFRAEGHVHSTTINGTGRDEMSAARVNAEMAPELNLPAKATADGGVKIESDRGGTTRHFESADLNTTFENTAPTHHGEKSSSHLSHAETQSSAILSWQEPAKKNATAANSPNQSSNTSANSHGAPGKMLLTGQRFQMAFTDDSVLKDLQVHGTAKVDRTIADGTEQISTSDELAAHLDQSGEWSEVQQDGHVRIHDPLHSAQGDHAHLDRASNILKLTGAAQIADADSRTNADTLELNQSAGDLHADGHVVTTYMGSASSTNSASTTNSTTKPAAAPIPLGSSQPGQPTHASSEHLAANNASGKAIYTGHARLWQADSSIAGDTIELDRTARQIDAQGSVHATFLEQPSTTQSSKPPSPPKSQSSANKSQASSQPSQPQLWKVRAAHMTYSDPEARAHLDGGFTAVSQEFSIAGQIGDLYFVPAASPAGPVTASPRPASSSSAQTLDHATAQGKVAVRQGDRHGTADRGEYTAADGKFTLSGGNPTFYDAAGNSTTGRQLTFFTSNDTVLVQSENTSLPPPQHRVEK
jgi:lipopolysaccharide export system protein LptA